VTKALSATEPRRPGLCGKDGDYKFSGSRMSELPKKNGNPWSKNAYPGRCARCGEWIPAGEGVRVGSPPREDGGKWTWNVYC
jgi:hypothetical protein